eukprot:gene15215-18006_t
MIRLFQQVQATRTRLQLIVGSNNAHRKYSNGNNNRNNQEGFNEDWEWWFKQRGWSILTGTVGVIGAYCNKDRIVGDLKEEYKKKRVYQAFVNGVCPTYNEAKETYVERNELVESIVSRLKPDKTTCMFSLIYGETGTGKTTAILQACRQVGGGVVYVSVPSNAGGFERALGQAFNLDTDKMDCYSEVTGYIDMAAKEYTDRHKGCPPVLVIDSIDYLGHDMLWRLEYFAKRHADSRDLIVVLVADDRDTSVYLKSEYSAFSRCRHMEIGDISDHDAVTYIAKRTGQLGLAEKVVSELTGGRFHLINSVIYSINSGSTYEDIKSKFKTK